MDLTSLFWCALTFSQFVGLLPVTVVYKTNTRVHKGTFIKYSKKALLLSISLLLSLAMKVYTIHFVLWDTTVPPDLRTQVIILSIIEACHAGFTVISCYFNRFWETLLCLNKAFKILQTINPKHPFPRVRYSSVILGLSNILHGVVRVCVKPDLIFLLFNVPDVALSTVCLSVSGIVVSVNVACCLSYKFINSRIHHLDFGKEKLLQREVNALLELHWKTGDLALLSTETFGFEILVRCVYIISKSVILSHITYSVDDNEFKFGFYMLAIFDMLIWLTDLFVLGATCDEMDNLNKETKCLLYKHLRMHYGELNWKSIQMLEAFILQTEHRNIQFSPRGFFILNRALSYNIATVTIAYVVLLIQFQKFEE